jgi:hypothetical protein
VTHRSPPPRAEYLHPGCVHMRHFRLGAGVARALPEVNAYSMTVNRHVLGNCARAGVRLPRGGLGVGTCTRGWVFYFFHKKRPYSPKCFQLL